MTPPHNIKAPLYIDLKSLCIKEFLSISATTPLVMQYSYVGTDFGIAFVAVHDGKLSSLEFIETPPVWKNIEFVRDDEFVLSILKQKNLAVLLIGTPFQINVWKALATIPCGTLISYSGLAASMGRPTSTRAVASAVARNKIGYLIPCHRVIRSDGSYGQFRWSPHRKTEMIKKEVCEIL